MFIIVLSFCAFFLPLLSDVKLYFFYHFLFETKINKKTWETLNTYFSNKLQFERKLYYYRPGLTTRETKMRAVGMRSFIFWVNCREILDYICSKRVLPVEHRKSEHHHWILHIWISLGIKFQLKLTILSFWTKFAQ